MKLKKTILSLAAIVMLNSNISTKANGFEPIEKRTPQTYESIVKANSTPNKVWQFFNEELKYKLDKNGIFVDHRGVGRNIQMNIPDFMKNPIDTYLRGGGTCKDYSRLGAETLRSHGYETKIIGVLPFDEFGSNDLIGHAICAVKEGDKWSYLSNDAYKTGYNTIHEAVRTNIPKWGIYFEVFPNENQARGSIIRNVIAKDEQIKIKLKDVIERLMYPERFPNSDLNRYSSRHPHQNYGQSQYVDWATGRPISPPTQNSQPDPADTYWKQRTPEPEKPRESKLDIKEELRYYQLVNPIKEEKIGKSLLDTIGRTTTETTH